MSALVPCVAVLAGSGIYVGKQVADYLRERSDVVSRVISMPANETVSVVEFRGSRVIDIEVTSLGFITSVTRSRWAQRTLTFTNSTLPIQACGGLSNVEQVSSDYANTPSALTAFAEKHCIDISTGPLTLPVQVYEGVHYGPLFYDAETKTVSDSIPDMAHAIASKKVPFDNLFPAAIIGLVALATIAVIRR